MCKYPNPNFAQMEGKCYCCQKNEYKSSGLHKDTPQEYWAINMSKTEDFTLSQIGNPSYNKFFINSHNIQHDEDERICQQCRMDGS